MEAELQNIYTIENIEPRVTLVIIVITLHIDINYKRMNIYDIK